MEKIKSYTNETNRFRVVSEDINLHIKGENITIPKGFHYRPGISLRIGSLGLFDIFGPTYAFEDIVCVHDYLYANRDKHSLDRREADSVFLEAKVESEWMKHTVYLVIRLFGWIVW